MKKTRVLEKALFTIFIVFTVILNLTCRNQFVIDILDDYEHGKDASGRVQRIIGGAITIECIGNGTATIYPDSPIRGEQVTISAEPAPGSVFMGWQVLESRISLSNTTTNPATFEMPGRNVIIRAIFLEMFMPPIVVDENTWVFNTTPQGARVQYGDDSEGNQITAVEAGTINFSYSSADGTRYNSGSPPVNAGIYGIYLTTTGGYSYAPISAEVNVGTLTIYKATGDPVSTPGAHPQTPKYNSIRIMDVSPPPSGQAVEYAINTTASPPAAGWQPGLVFDDLNPLTKYYIFARSQENNNYNAGPPSASLIVTTLPVPEIRIVEGNIVLPEGGTKQLNVIGMEPGATITWTDSNSAIATVNSAGLVTGLAQGSARITATSSNPFTSYTITVSVQRESSWININNGPTDQAHGSINILDPDAGKFTMTSNGEIELNGQYFSFISLDAAAVPFTMTVKLDSIRFGTGTGTSPALGIIAIPKGDVSATGTNLRYASALSSMSLGSSTRRFWLRYRDSGNYSQVQIGTGTAPDSALSNGRWLRLSRNGTLFTAAYSDDGGATWVSESITVSWTGDVYVGLCVAAGKQISTLPENRVPTIAGFSEWSFVKGNDNPTQAEVNATSNRVNLSNL